MGWGFSPKEGRDYCAGSCEHSDCPKMREFVKKACHYCGKEIGQDARVYLEDSVPVHAVCAELATEQKG